MVDGCALGRKVIYLKMSRLVSYVARATPALRLMGR